MSGLENKPPSSSVSSSASLLPHCPPSSSSSSYNSLSVDPSADKENAVPVADVLCYGRCAAADAKPPSSAKGRKVQLPGAKAASRVLAERQQNVQVADVKSSSLKLCMRLSEPERPLGILGLSEPIPYSSDVWDFPDSEAAPASSWSTLPNRKVTGDRTGS